MVRSIQIITTWLLDAASLIDEICIWHIWCMMFIVFVSFCGGGGGGSGDGGGEVPLRAGLAIRRNAQSRVCGAFSCHFLPSSFPPPVTRGLLDFISACPPSSSFLRRASTASSRSQCSLLGPSSNLYQIKCQKDCQNICQIHMRKNARMNAWNDAR